MTNLTELLTIILPAPRPCSIFEDGHRAQATHHIQSDGYGFVAGFPRARLFCESCAQAEAAFLEEEGYTVIVAEVATADRESAPVEPQPSLLAWAGDEPVWGRLL